MASHTRMVLDLDIAQKKLIERAAANSGLSLPDFARDALLREAQRIISFGGDVILSDAESRLFIDEIDLPFQPNAKLTKAIKIKEPNIGEPK